MAVYTVHEPLPRKDEASADPERFAFVRDGFHFWAFLLGPVWMLWRRLWLVTVFYFGLTVALQGALWMLNATGAVKFLVWLLLSLLIGFEAGTLRRWTLTRRGWKPLGVVVGEDREAAERNFFAAWVPPVASMPAIPSSRAVAAPSGIPRGGDDVLGLFPQPGAPR